jgi:uncharacterized phage protein (TIGR01671 family)
VVQGYGIGERDEEIVNLGSKIFRVPPKSKNPIDNYRKLKKIMQNGKYDIVHSHADSGNAFVLNIAKIVGVNVRISHSHNTDYTISNKFRIFLNDIQKRQIDKYATHKWACSEVAGKWIYGDIAHVQGEPCIQTDVSDNEKRGTIGWNVDDSTIGQFTGVHDKNSKEIYEGDIIRSYASNGEPLKHQIYYLDKEARFATKLIGYDELNEGELTQRWVDEIGFEVIGNIFDNPELLKKGE